MARKRRDLTPDEAELWGRVKRTAAPLHPERRDQAVAPAPETKAATAPAPPRAQAADLSKLSLGGRSATPAPTHRVQPPLSERLSRQAVRMDNKSYGRMRRGKLPVEGRIDLHGLTLAEAQPRLISFVLASHAAGRRLVLVITGKGRDQDTGDPIPLRRGILRHQVPQWLGSGQLRACVLQVSEAHRRHGGSGAFYVYLRRK